MDNDKISEIGEKLDVNATSIVQGKNRRLITRPLYFLIQILIFGVSSIIGLSLVTIKEHATYPFEFTLQSIPLSLLALSLQAGNGVFTIPGQEKFGLSRNVRITTFLINLLTSLIAIKLILDTATNPFPSNVTYGVFDTKP